MEQLTLDVDQERLYWVNGGAGTIESVDYRGHHHQSISSGDGGPASLGFHDKFVFWINSAKKTLTRARKADGHNVFTVFSDQDDGGPRRLAIVSSGRPGGKYVTTLVS